MILAYLTVLCALEVVYIYGIWMVEILGKGGPLRVLS